MAQRKNLKMAMHMRAKTSGKKQSKDVIGLQKLIKIQELEKKSSDDIIWFTKEQYYELVIQNPRPYDVVLIFMYPYRACRVCPYLEQEFKQTVYSFNGERGKVGGGINRGFQEDKKIFFGILMYEKGEDGQTGTSEIF